MRDEALSRMQQCMYCKEGIVLDVKTLDWWRSRAKFIDGFLIDPVVCRQSPDTGHRPDEDVAEKAARRIAEVAGDVGVPYVVPLYE